MVFGQLDQTHILLRLEKGEEIASTLYTFFEKNTIFSAQISGLGSVENPTLAHYRVDTKEYTEKELSGIFEVTNLAGNVATFAGKPLVHIHMTLSDENMQARAGHLVKATVSATLELIITLFAHGYEKKQDDTIGLKLFDLSKIVR